MIEKEIEKRVKTYAESKGWLTRKWTSPGHSFVPDQIFIRPDGTVFFVEFKRHGGVATAGQLREHDKLRKQGCVVWVVDSVELGKEVVDAYSC
jgi:hypothetical protein